MAKQTSFAHQKVVLMKFSQTLSNFEQELKSLIKRYEEDVHSLYEDQGLMEEIYSEYQSTYLESMKASLYEVAARVPAEDIPFIEREIDFISSR